MKATLILLLLQMSHVMGFSQNLEGDYTENDFIRRGSKKLTLIYTEVDTVSHKAKKSKTTLTARFDPNSRIITIRNLGSKGEKPHYRKR